MRAYAFLAGDCPELLPGDHPERGDFLLAVDGGYDHLRRMGMIPELLLGDFDSLPPKSLQEAEKLGVALQRWPVAKDFSDADLALRELADRGFKQVRLCGALGGARLDHELANIGLMALWKRRGLDIQLLHGNLWVSVIEQQKLLLSGHPGDIVSLLPLTTEVTKVTCHGLQYPLQRETLFAGQSRSLSNAFAGEYAEIELGAGLLLVLHYRSL